MIGWPFPLAVPTWVEQVESEYSTVPAARLPAKAHNELSRRVYGCMQGSM